MPILKPVSEARKLSEGLLILEFSVPSYGPPHKGKKNATGEHFHVMSQGEEIRGSFFRVRGEPRRAHENPGEPRRAQESSGDHRRAEDTTGEPRRPQESPGAGEPRAQVCVCVVLDEAIKAQRHLTTTKAMQQRLNFKFV